MRRIYSIDEVKRSARLRDSVRRLEVGNLTFDSGKATISRNQVGALSKVANAMRMLLRVAAAVDLAVRNAVTAGVTVAVAVVAWLLLRG